MTKSPEEIEVEQTEEDISKEELLKFFITDPGESDKKTRTFGLYGDVDEDVAASVIYALLSLRESGIKTEIVQDDEDETKEEIVTTHEPMTMMVSTHGGVAHEMFAIYDTMRMVQETCDIETIGMGKVMSAGVLLLAAGTKGKRRIGRNCRVMIHPVAAASMGDLIDIENETKEIKVLQKQYVTELVNNTKLTVPQIKKMMKKKLNIYLSAEEAVKLGIADEVI